MFFMFHVFMSSRIPNPLSVPLCSVAHYFFSEIANSFSRVITYRVPLENTGEQ